MTTPSKNKDAPLGKQVFVLSPSAGEIRAGPLAMKAMTRITNRLRKDSRFTLTDNVAQCWINVISDVSAKVQ